MASYSRPSPHYDWFMFHQKAECRRKLLNCSQHTLVLLHRESFKNTSNGIGLLPSAFLLPIRGLATDLLYEDLILHIPKDVSWFIFFDAQLQCPRRM